MIGAITLCLLICFEDKPKVVSDFCKLTRQEIAQLQALTPDERAHLQRPRKNAIASLRRSFQAHCPHQDTPQATPPKKKKRKNGK